MERTAVRSAFFAVGLYFRPFQGNIYLFKPTHGEVLAAVAAAAPEMRAAK